MPEYVIVNQGVMGFSLSGKGPNVANQFLASFDPEAHDGWGYATWTKDLDQAMKFVDQAAGMDCWRTIPKSRPTRPDGAPNRPLTVFTIAISPVEDFA